VLQKYNKILKGYTVLCKIKIGEWKYSKGYSFDLLVKREVGKMSIPFSLLTYIRKTLL
jgi:hypothetical protein